MQTRKEATVSLAYDASDCLIVDSLECSNPIYRHFIAGYRGSETGGSTSPSTTSSSSNASDSSKSVVRRLLPKTGQETGVVLATLGLLSLAGIAIVSLRKKF